MSNRFFSYHNTAIKLISTYQKQMPLQHFLKQYFAENKKHGSKDRKWISHFCYCFYRLGKSLSNIEMDERLKIAVYLCTSDLTLLTEYLPENWLRTESLDEKIVQMHDQFGFNLEDIFPYRELLMPEIDFVALNKSFLQQPDVFLRIRPGREKSVIEKLNQSSTEYQRIGTSAVRLKTGTSVDKILDINTDAVIQDLSSQAIADLFPATQISSIWDCCAASGGKTILARDQYPKAKIYVSDIRSSILQNHKKRMQEAGVSVQHYQVIDLSKPLEMGKEKFDLIICDAPCSGSGTFARTPEEMYFFEKESLKSIESLQLTIVNTIFELLNEGGYLLYITCSLFEKENNLLIHPGSGSSLLSIINSQVILGLSQQADIMYGCLLQKNRLQGDVK